MDSMRSLNTSLPSTPRPQPSEQLIQHFKTAALSVTNLYKNAAHMESQARQAGYQEAIEDLLHLLDRENLGLIDGEGWRVRQWATERSDGLGHTSDDDEAERRTRSATPAVPRKEPSESEAPRQSAKSTPHREEQVAASQPPSSPAVQASETTTVDNPSVFTFSAGPTFPQAQEQDLDMQNLDTTPPSLQSDTPVSVSVLSRNPRQQNRHGNMSRPNPRTSTRDSPVGIGSKRKIQFPDFFDLSGMGNNRDMFGGGKRGRFT
ncbi:hypothetical protein BJX99DRAFT_226771 [Aspergillus californicus]